MCSTTQKYFTAELGSSSLPRQGFCEQLGTVLARTWGCDLPSLQGSNEHPTRELLSKVKPSKPNRKTVRYSAVPCLAYGRFAERCRRERVWVL